ncbi:MAG: hypothetical protein MUF23_14675 [Pirellula sp.]|jgi:hypothetical protein|nr:hypothetical protein [Pirellula sp.]
MASKKQRGSSSHEPDAPRPVAFLFAALIAAGVSTWYWYRPLPQRAAEVNHGAFVAQPSSVPDRSTFPKSRSKWKDAGLIFPSDDPVTSSPPSQQNSPADVAGAADLQALTGSQDLALQRFQEKSQPLKDWVHREPLPMVPVTGADSLTAQALPKPKLWTNAPVSPDITQAPSSLMASESHSGSKSTSVSPADPDAPSPFRVPRVESPARTTYSSLATAPAIWPDQGFDPSRPPVAPPVINLPTQGSLATGANSIPSQGEPMDGMTTTLSQRIRTMDREPDKSLPPPMEALPVTNPPRSPLSKGPSQRGTVIRQPPPK